MPAFVPLPHEHEEHKVLPNSIQARTYQNVHSALLAVHTRTHGFTSTQSMPYIRYASVPKASMPRRVFVIVDVMYRGNYIEV